MSHLEEGTIHAWLDGALPPDEAAHVEAHVRDCAECAALVAEARGFIAGASRIVSSLDVVRGDVIPASLAPKPPARNPALWSRLRLTPARAAIAATILVGVASMFSLRHRTFADAADNASFNAPRAVLVAPASAPAAAAPQPVLAQPRAVDSLSAVPRREDAVSANRAAEAKRSAAVSATASAAPSSAPLPAPAPIPPLSTTPATAGASGAVAAPVAPVSRLAAPSRPPFRDSLALSEVVVTGLAEPRKPTSSAAAPAAATSDGRAQSARAVPNVAGDNARLALDRSSDACYRLHASSIAALPDAFRLEHDSASGRPTVRSRPAAGRDSVLDGATWRLSTPDVVLLTIPNSPRGATQLTFPIGGGSASISTSDGSTTATIERVSCTR